MPQYRGGRQEPECLGNLTPAKANSRENVAPTAPTAPTATTRPTASSSSNTTDAAIAAACAKMAISINAEANAARHGGDETDRSGGFVLPTFSSGVNAAQPTVKKANIIVGVLNEIHNQYEQSTDTHLREHNPVFLSQGLDESRLELEELKRIKASRDEKTRLYGPRREDGKNVGNCHVESARITEAASRMEEGQFSTLVRAILSLLRGHDLDGVEHLEEISQREGEYGEDARGMVAEIIRDWLRNNHAEV